MNTEKGHIKRGDFFVVNNKEGFIEREGISNGKVRMVVKDGSGKCGYKRVFAGNVNPEQQHSNGVAEYRFGVEYNTTQEGSLGSNTLTIESKLRATKKVLGYEEPERRGSGGKRIGAGRPKQ